MASPPSPVLYGSVRFNEAATATAASFAFPPIILHLAMRRPRAL